MAKIKKLPNQAIISGFRGTLDFYLCRGIICVRKWPDKFRGVPSAARQAQWAAFATAGRLWTTLSPEVQKSYKEMTGKGGLNGRDLFTKSYISGIYRYAHTPIT